MRRQCELLGLPGSTAYYAPIPESEENLALRIYLRNYGSVADAEEGLKLYFVKYCYVP